MSATAATGETFETKIPERMDRLPWTRWHWLVVLALGTVWILDGLEVTIVGSIGAVLTSQETLAFSEAQIGLLGSIYVAGAVVGSLTFGYLTDRLGRKRLFFVTLAVYTIATATTAFAWDFWSFAAFRFLTGSGIGGEYAAINSAIDELIPARVVAEPLSAEGDGTPERGDEKKRTDGGPPRRQRSFWSSYPAISGVASRPDTALPREVDLIEQALSDEGPLDRRSLARRVRTRLWGARAVPAGACARGRVRTCARTGAPTAPSGPPVHRSHGVG